MRTALGYSLAFCLFLLGTVSLTYGKGSLWREWQKQVNEAYRKQDARTLGNLLEKIAQQGSKKAVRYVLKVLRRTVSWEECYDGAVEGLSQVKTREGTKEISRALASNSTPWKVRILLIEVVAKWPKEEAKPALLKAAKASKRPVAAFAIRTLAKIGRGDREIVEGILRIMEKKDRRRDLIWEECQSALRTLLGVTFHSAAEYRSWVQSRGYSYQESDKKQVFRTTVRSFFGVPVHCKRSVFIIDVSGSMKTVDPEPLDGRHAGTTVRGAGGEPKINLERMRIRRAKKELIRVIRELQSSQYFNVIAFSSDVWVWSPKGCKKATKSNKESAIQFVQNFSAKGVTVTDLALMKAYEVNPKAECFYLLSDGAPTRDGQNIIPTEEILELVIAKDRFRKVRIHTLGFPGASVEFMKALARLTGGVYRDIR